MNKFITVGIGAIGAYLLWKYGLPSFGSKPAVAPAGPGTLPVSTLTRDLVLKAAGGGNPLLNVDEWNFYYSKVRGGDGIAPEVLLPDAPRERKLTIDEWWGAASNAGLQGLGVIVRSSLGIFSRKSSDYRFGWGF